MKTIYQQHVRQEILARLQKLSEDKKPLWGKMNAAEMLSHQNDAFRMFTGERELTDAGNFMLHTIGKFMVLNLPYPKNAKTHPEMNPKDKGSKPRSFTDEKADFTRLLEKAGAVNNAGQRYHPVLGKLNHQQWGDHIAKHVDHHFRQFGI
jgi:hypothetical protein